MVAAGLLVLSLVAFAQGAPTPDVMRVHERRAAPPNGFVKTTPGADADSAVVSLRIALKSDPAPLHKALLDVSTPGSANYRKFLTKAETDALVAPSADGLAAIDAWLSSANVTSTPAATNQWLNIDVPVASANALLDADFQTYTNAETGKTAIRTLAYSLPKSVQPFVDFVFPATSFPVQSAKGVAAVHHARAPLNPAHPVRAAVAASCADTVTPTCLQALYNIPTDPATSAKNTLAVSSFVQSNASTTDLSDFLTSFRPDLSSQPSFEVTSVDNGVNDETDPSVEGSLDIQYTVGIATNVPTTFFVVGENNDGDVGGFLDLVNTFLAAKTPPTTFTTSFGFPEELISADLAQNLCNAYAQLGARGVSAFFSSGDSGVDDGQGGTCTTFRPTFPASCPFVTVVGSTTGISPETAADFSSGGFSNVFDQPSYQADAVGNYLSLLGNTNAGLFNTTGRGYPDVSAQGVSYQVNIGGTVSPVSGTSASTPLFASIVSLLNDRLIAGGKSPLGFMNPFLYAGGQVALNDVVSGSNPGCGTDGFPAKSGWDPVTGLGTPDFKKFSTLLGI
ncbi:family S53 protease-like protein [Epithele typhae]|uniref:family S53 protease-like protein n=1 Tax=Epithele typhae TaxID=378194 RepID=UPI0020075710|nr:family S53 protease-like protein [Epithele typhae]KAH9940472.1 family S53 protease-like protein [Epithele typhae]